MVPGATAGDDKPTQFYYVTEPVPITASDKTGSSAIAEGPRGALSQLKSCQLLHNCMKNHI